MSSHQSVFFIGWDVGGWNCDKNGSSRDAIIILDETLAIIGKPWRGNLRESINSASCTHEWLSQLFGLCKAEVLPAPSLLAIDTPLGFSQAFTRLVTAGQYENPIGTSASNPYLFRQTERFLYEHGITPLSPIKDMIGSQATKGIHVLSRFAQQVIKTGVWTDGEWLTAIEAYPSPCKRSALIHQLWQVHGSRWNQWTDHQDKQDALTCALIAHTFASRPELLAQPPDTIPVAEGWIWLPKGALQADAANMALID